MVLANKRIKYDGLHHKSMTVEELIVEMQAVNQSHPTLEISDVLRIFSIQAMKDLTSKIEHVRMSLYGR